MSQLRINLKLSKNELGGNHKLMKSELQVIMNGLWNGCIIYEWMEIYVNSIHHVTISNTDIQDI
jgi:hypothetical protein